MPAPPRREPLTLAALGDSLTQGVGDETGLGWVGRLAAQMSTKRDVTTYNLGVRGNTTLELSRRAAPELRARLDPALENWVLLCVGTNDASLYKGKPRVPLGRSLQLVERTLDAIQDYGRLFWISPVPVAAGGRTFEPQPGETFHFANERMKELSDAFMTVARERDIPYFDLLAHFEVHDLSVHPTSDGIHPRSGGYQVLFEAIASWRALRL